MLGIKNLEHHRNQEVHGSTNMMIYFIARSLLDKGLHIVAENYLRDSKRDHGRPPSLRSETDRIGIIRYRSAVHQLDKGSGLDCYNASLQG